MSRANRYDLAPASSLAPPEQLENGWLRVDGRISRVGVQEYRDSRGKVRRELRLPEEVFAPEALASFALVPLTNDHPPKMLDAKTAAVHSIGAVGEPAPDGDFAKAQLMIHDARAIEAARAGRVQLSCGYSCELDSTQDAELTKKWGRYDFIQRGIRGNHVALVDKARAGADARIRLDRSDAVAVSETEQEEDKQMATEKNTEECAGCVTERARADAAEGKLAAIEATRVDTAEKTRNGARDFARAVEARVGLETAAHRIGLRDNAIRGADDALLRQRMVRHLSPSLVLDGKDESFVIAALETLLVSSPKRRHSAVDSARGAAFPRSPQDYRTARERMIERERETFLTDAEPATRSSSAEEARQRMIARERAAYRDPIRQAVADNAKEKAEYTKRSRGEK